MFFRDVVGQQSIKNRLIRSVKEERISHAQLFSGGEGRGKLAMAIAYAQYISCHNRGAEDSCGTCPSCHKYQKLAHPDLHFVFPIFNPPGPGKPTSDDFLKEWREMISLSPYFSLGSWLKHIKAGNAQGMIYERESESILRKLNLKAFESEFKIMIIWLPEKMHMASSNKLLKIIEEPPSKTLFLLITENEDGVIGTIRSRAQLVKFPPIENKAMREALLKLEGTNENAVSDAIHLSDGNYINAREAIHPNEEDEFYFQKFQEMMRQAYKREVIQQVEWAEEMASIGRDKQKAFFIYSLRMVREYFVSNLKQPGLVYMKQEEKDWGKRFAPFINERNIIPFYKEFELGFQHISANGNPRIIFLDTALRMVRLIKR